MNRTLSCVGIMSFWCRLVLAIGKGLDCMGIEHQNGSASYYLQGMLGAGDCAIEWSSNNTVIAHESASHDMVLTRTTEHLTIQTCKDTVLYMEDCPASGVVQKVLCFCNCTIKGSSKESSNEIPPKVVGRDHQIVIAVIGVISCLFLLFLFIIVYSLKKKRRILGCILRWTKVPVQEMREADVNTTAEVI
ncbi:hypothetical protein MATL_G00129260 [Megalops atlanticus]|uniref:Sperm acrosome membrane-associated protein 1 n=1 Tax=Megalops atlanticus TaxID=7932 RepID=A0A9D3TBT2_MEGAT|nr:hypothetical protein MATL_G00129260 [Megalops atlanticus]